MDKTGGPAFPTGTAFQGMTLRDYFAAKAMQSFMTVWMTQAKCFENFEVAKYAYDMADAMLETREK